MGSLPGIIFERKIKKNGVEKFNLRIKAYLLRNESLSNDVGGFKIDGQHENFWA